MDRLDAMTVLVAAAEEGSLSAAARQLGMPLATVSRKVSDLEAHLGTRLLIRSSRRLGLTESGSDYVAAARRILEQVGEAERTAAGEFRAPKGELTLSAPIVFGRLHLVPVVAAFLAAYTDINVSLTLTDRVVHLAEDHVDAALRIGDLPDSSLVAIRLGAIRRVVCASPAYLAARGEPQAPADLTQHDAVLFEALGPAWQFGTETVRPRPRLTVNTAEAAVDAAVAGVGLTRVLSYQAVRAVADGRLKRILAAFEPEPVPVSLIHAGQGPLPLKLRAFLDFAVPRLKGARGPQ